MGFTTGDVPHSACVRTYAVKHTKMSPDVGPYKCTHTHTHTHTRTHTRTHAHTYTYIRIRL